jgi:nucleoside-triphosphatase THEP1
MGRIVILTGKRGAGKSTVCHKTVALAQAKDYTCAGLITLSHPDGALDVLDVRAGDTRWLTLASDVQPAVIQGRFRFDPQTLAWGNGVFAQAPPCNLLVVDELGPLELARKEGWTKAFVALGKNSFALALVVVRPELVVQAQMRLPASATVVFAVTPDSRNGLPATLLEILERQLGAMAL